MAIPRHHAREACAETRSSRACSSAGLDAEVGYRAGTGQQEVGFSRPKAAALAGVDLGDAGDEVEADQVPPCGGGAGYPCVADGSLAA
jgi:hypothetical protein